MSFIGILGGMGPLATVDFMDKLVRLTPAKRDQDHLPVIVANLPHVHDRSTRILGGPKDPLPQLLDSMDVLNRIGVGVVAIPCNSSHHWYEELSRRSHAPILHIAQTCVEAMETGPQTLAAVLATRGALASGFYQRALQQRGIGFLTPRPDEQDLVDQCIRAVKAGEYAAAGGFLSQACALMRQSGANAAIMACTEIPVALRNADVGGMTMVDSSLELARATVEYALARGWNRPGWDS